MSFLEHLQTRKKSLKPTETVVTCADGTRYIDSQSGNAALQSLPKTHGFVVDTTPDSTPALVMLHLYLGAQDCCAPDIIKQHNITCVLSIGIEAPHQVPKVTYHYIECLDLPDMELKPVLTRANGFIRNAIAEKRNVLVHCNAGVSRSVAVVIGFLMTEMGQSFEEALQCVKKVRPVAQPNSGFVKQLKNL